MRRLLCGVGSVLILSACGDDPYAGAGPLDAGDASTNDVTPPIADGSTPDTGHDAKRPLTASECGATHPDWIFCSGFEEGSKAIWDDFDGNPSGTNDLMADPGPVDAPSNHVMRLRVPPGRGGADLVKVLSGSHDKLYARWYEKWENGYDFSAPNHGGGLHAGDRNWLGHSNTRPLGDDWYSSWIEPIDGQLNAYVYRRGMYQDCVDPNGTCFGDHFPCFVGSQYCTVSAHKPGPMAPKLKTGEWHCIETMLDGGTPTPTEAQANGALDFWVDGQEIGPWTGLWMRTAASVKVDVLWLSVFHHGAHSVEGVMLDDVVVSTSRIGCRE